MKVAILVIVGAGAAGVAMLRMVRKYRRARQSSDGFVETAQAMRLVSMTVERTIRRFRVESWVILERS